MTDKRISEYAARVLTLQDLIEVAGEVGGSPTALDNYKSTLAELRTLLNVDPTLTRPIIGVTTWANRPAAASYAGAIIRISDIGTPSSLWISDGTRWYPLNGQVNLGQSGAAVSCAANTSENFLASVTVPRGALGPHGRLSMTTMWSFTASANTKTARIRFSGNSGTIFRDIELSGGSSAGVQNALGATILNTGAANAQASAQSAAGSTAVAAVTATVDTDAADTTVVFSGQKGASGDTFTLRWYFVTLATP